MKPIDRLLLVAVVVTCIIGALAIRNLDQDDKLIDRGQVVTNCIGDRADAIDDWRAVFLGLQTELQEEFVAQVERVQDGVPIQTARAGALAQQAYDAERNIRLLVQEKRDIRETSRVLIEDGETDFTCPPIAEPLVPPPLSD